MNAEEAFHELCGYTLALGDAAFIHQHVVDAYAAKTADESTKLIKLTFALVGLYLHIDRQFTGKLVQQIHMRLAQRKRAWPRFPLPLERGAMGPAEVLSRPAGPDRNRAIEDWCVSVWTAYGESHQAVAAMLRDYGIE